MSHATEHGRENETRREAFLTGRDLRAAARTGDFTGHTSGYAAGFVQTNLVILPRDWAWDFLLFAQRNPKPCPILEVGEAGDPLTHEMADGADIRRDVPSYRVYEHGDLVDETGDISSLWRNDLVFFLLGCSFTFERALLDAGMKLRHNEEGVNVPMFRTGLLCRAAGRFQPSPMVVSMRPFTPREAIRAVEITREYPAVHGSPVHLGDPGEIGIEDLNRPEWGDPVTVRPGEIPVFWACGITPQNAALVSRPPLMITHSPGHMFVGDIRDHALRLSG
jgi:uncharacterized protein YcsI (UPF0317 family)